MNNEKKEGLFVVSENTHHYNSAPSGTQYTFMKGRGLWIKDPLDIAFFKGKVERGSGFRIEKEALNIADKIKVVKKEKAASESITEKIKKKIPKRKPVATMSKEELQNAVAELEATEVQEPSATEDEDEEVAE